MKRLFLYLLCLIWLEAFSQVSDTGSKVLPTMDSIIKKETYSDSPVSADLNRRNMEYILELQNENRARQKKAAFVRIAIGVGFLALLVVGIMRRRKKKIEQ
jgi:hypothetical protein